MALHNIWEDFVRANEDITFATLRPRTGPRSFQDFFLSTRGRSFVQDAFNRRLGTLALSGEPPNIDLFDFLQTFDFGGEFQNLTPNQRGDSSTGFNPRLKFLNFRGR